jgi:tetratricopeptide (TPR) repeat protein
MALFIAGIPVSAFLAWAFQITSEGIRLEVASLKGGLAVTIAISLMLGISAVLFQRIDSGPTPAINTQGLVGLGNSFTAAVNSVAVLPIVSDDDQLTRTFTGEITERLSRHADLYVVANTFDMAPRFASLGPAIRQQELKVENTVEGSISVTDEGHLLSLKLYNSSRQEVWQDEFLFGADAESQRGLQLRVSQKLAQLLGTRRPSAEYCEPSNNIQAIENYHAARLLLNRKGPENLAEAERLLKEAIDLDPNYGRPYSALAISYLLQRRPGGMRLAVDLSKKALNRCATLGAAYKIWVPAYEGVSNPLINDELQWRDALAMEPNHLWLLDNYGMSTADHGLLNEAFQVIERNFRNNPLEPRAIVTMGWAVANHFQDYSRARQLALQAKELGDNSCNAEMILLMVARWDPDSTLDEAVTAYNNVPQRCKDAMLSDHDELGIETFYTAGTDPAARRRVLDWAERYLDTHPNRAIIQGVELNDPDLAHRGLRSALDNDKYFHPPAFWMNTEGSRLFRRDPRFVEVMKEVGMDEYWREFGWPSNGMCTPFGDSFVCDS